MNLIGAEILLLCDENFNILHRGGIIFGIDSNLDSIENLNIDFSDDLDNKKKIRIIEIGDYLELEKKYKNHINKAKFFENCVLCPSFANLHTHLEFSQNNGHLCFGNGFGAWLNSVMQNREELMGGDLQSSIDKEILNILRSGTSLIGEISSNGAELESLAQSPLRVIFFNEAIGSNPSALDFLLSNFKARFNDSLRFVGAKFRAAVAIHSPYSVHFKMLQKVLEFAAKQSKNSKTNFICSAHFLESKEEKQWLEQKSGYFAKFYENFFNSKQEPFYSSSGFLESISSNLKDNFIESKNSIFLFTHCCECEEEHFSQIAALNGRVVSCVRSNFLLCDKTLNLQKCRKAGLLPLFATDGLSSNFTLNILDEARAAFLAHSADFVGFLGDENSKKDLIALCQKASDLSAFKEILDSIESSKNITKAAHLAQEILLSISARSWEAVGLFGGVLKSGAAADFALFELDSMPYENLKNTNENQYFQNSQKDKIILNFLFKAREAKALFIAGEQIF